MRGTENGRAEERKSGRAEERKIGRTEARRTGNGEQRTRMEDRSETQSEASYRYLEIQKNRAGDVPALLFSYKD